MTRQRAAKRAQVCNVEEYDEELFMAVCNNDRASALPVIPGLPSLVPDLTNLVPEVLSETADAPLSLEAAADAPLHTEIANRTDSSKPWTTDSGATISMTADVRAVSNLTPVCPALRIRTAGPVGLLGTHRGRLIASFKRPAGGGSRTRIDLGNVLLVPELQDNLLSVPALADAGFSVSFDKSSCCITGTEAKLTALRIGDSYVLDIPYPQEGAATAASEADVNALWHRRFGHPGRDRTAALSDAVVGAPQQLALPGGICDTCATCKITRLPFPGPGDRADELLGIVHGDLQGPMGVDGWDGSKYVLNLVDDASRCCATYLLKNKSDALGRFMDFVRSAERQSGKKLKIFRSDNGGEFTGRAFKDFLSENGIAHQLSVPRTPQQNGVAERVGRTITTITRAILRDSNLPQLRWPDAMRHATHLYNRTPHSSVLLPARLSGSSSGPPAPKPATPYHAWHGEAPDVSHLRIFGCIAFSHDSGPRAPECKYAPRGRPYVHVGTPPGVKGYRLLDPVTGQCFVSRDVIFDETRVWAGGPGGGPAPAPWATPCFRNGTTPRSSGGLHRPSSLSTLVTRRIE